MYPANARPVIVFDEKGLCSGCRYVESRKSINWEERLVWFKDLIQEYKSKAKEKQSPYDCIIPVSGGKDSTYQVYLLKEVYKLNPLLVTFNHSFNTKIGLRNLNNLLNQSNCDLIRFTANRNSVKKITKFMLKKLGDITWHYHAGIMTFPMQIAAKYKIPLIIWGEEGFSELTGMFNQDDMIEFTKMKRQEHDMRGFEPEDLINMQESGLDASDLGPYFYPSDEEIESLDMRGIYLSNYINWDARKQTEEIIKNYGFEPLEYERDRTFNKYDKIEDAANGTHDYLKYLKFGYGRATDDASTEIRHGRMTREEGIQKVLKHDSQRPQDLDFMLEFLEISEEEFLNSIDHLRDKSIWEKDINGNWITKDNISNHLNDNFCDEVKLLQKNERTSYLSPQKKSKKKYYNDFEII